MCEKVLVSNNELFKLSLSPIEVGCNMNMIYLFFYQFYLMFGILMAVIILKMK
jgi:hypothetical protein